MPHLWCLSTSLEGRWRVVSGVVVFFVSRRGTRVPLLWCLSTSLEGRSASDVVLCSFLVVFCGFFFASRRGTRVPLLWCLSTSLEGGLASGGVSSFLVVCVVFFFVPRRGTRMPSLVVLVNLSRADWRVMWFFSWYLDR